MENSEVFNIKDSITVEGIAEDHVWYNSTLLMNKMSFWSQDFKKLVEIMEARHKEHLKMIADLLTERSFLKQELAVLKAKE